MKSSTYIHGTTKPEQARLASLNHLTNESFIRFLELRSSDSVLEVGSGTGILAGEVSKKLRNGEIYGVEASKEQLAATKHASSRLHFILSDAQSLPFEKNTFDKVYCRYILEHLSNPIKALKEIHRVLKPGGKIFLQENNISICMWDPDCPVFEEVWRKFALLQKKLGGDALIGKRLFSILKAAKYKNIELSLEPEIHYSGKKTFRPWVEILIENVEGAAKALIQYRLVTQKTIEKGILELRSLTKRSDASFIFYWNRAKAVK